MQRGYVRLSKTGLSRAEQVAALEKAGLDDFTDDGPVYFDEAPKKRVKPGADPLPARTLAIASLRAGDVLVVATPGCLGLSQDDISAALVAIGRRSASVLVVSTGRQVRGSPEAADAIDLAREGGSENAARKAARARRALAELGVKRGPAPKLEGKLLARAREMWPSPAYTVADIVKELGCSESSLRRKLGPRGTPLFGRK